MRRARLALWIVVWAACGGGGGPPRTAASGAGSAGHSAPAADEVATGQRRAPTVTEAPPEIAIQRSAIVRAVEAGLGRLLQQVRTEPHMDGDRFIGFRVVAVHPQWRAALPLRPGDTVTRLNGAPIGRPEQAQQAFDSLRVASELVLEYLRDGEVRVLRYAIE